MNHTIRHFVVGMQAISAEIKPALERKPTRALLTRGAAPSATAGE